MHHADWHNKWLLLVEDDDSSTEYLRELLSQTNINIILAMNGEQALQKFREHAGKIDIVLMDIRLPDIDGLEITKRIKTMKSTVIVIAQTAFAFVNDRQKFLHEGCDDYIAKPIMRKELLKKLGMYL